MHAGVAPAEAAVSVCTDLSPTLFLLPHPNPHPLLPPPTPQPVSACIRHTISSSPLLIGAHPHGIPQAGGHLEPSTQLERHSRSVSPVTKKDLDSLPTASSQRTTANTRTPAGTFRPRQLGPGLTRPDTKRRQAWTRPCCCGRV